MPCSVACCSDIAYCPCITTEFIMFVLPMYGLLFTSACVHLKRSLRMSSLPLPLSELALQTTVRKTTVCKKTVRKKTVRKFGTMHMEHMKCLHSHMRKPMLRRRYAALIHQWYDTSQEVLRPPYM
jgi:hypothetical protein